MRSVSARHCCANLGAMYWNICSSYLPRSRVWLLWCSQDTRKQHPFVEQGLRWCVAREKTGDAVGRGHLHLHPAWLQLLTADKQLIYISTMPPHRITSAFITAPTGGTCGGIPRPSFSSAVHPQDWYLATISIALGDE